MRSFARPRSLPPKMTGLLWKTQPEVVRCYALCMWACVLTVPMCVRWWCVRVFGARRFHNFHRVCISKRRQPFVNIFVDVDTCGMHCTYLRTPLACEDVYYCAALFAFEVSSRCRMYIEQTRIGAEHVWTNDTHYYGRAVNIRPLQSHNIHSLCLYVCVCLSVDTVSPKPACGCVCCACTVDDSLQRNPRTVRQLRPDRTERH